MATARYDGAQGPAAPPWQEVYEGGSQDAEEKSIQVLMEQMLTVQHRHREATPATHFIRTLHAKCLAASTEAQLVVDEDLPLEFQVAHFAPGAAIPARVRLSSASGVPFHDGAPDVRGMAVRLHPAAGGAHDLLLASQPASLARDAKQYVALLLIFSNGTDYQLAEMREAFGVEEASRMMARLKQDVRLCSSLALERFWSCGAVLWGRHPVRFEFRPLETKPGARTGFDPDALGREFADRLAVGAVSYRLALQRYVDEQQTPLEDCSREWPTACTPAVEIATLTLRQWTPASPTFEQQMSAIDATAFNPWNAPAEFRPLGNLNRARRLIYSASSHRWLKTPVPSK